MASEVLSFLLPLLLASAAQTAPFEDEIRRFEELDRSSPSARGAVLFVGGSSIRLWSSLQKDFPGAEVLNRGFGGAELSDLVRLADRVVLPYRPSKIVLYAGDNDLAAGKKAEAVHADFTAFTRKVFSGLPEARILYVSIKPSPSRWHLKDEILKANSLIRAETGKDPRLYFVDVCTPMLGPDGLPRKELFLEDLLHMNAAGYALWTRQVQEELWVASASRAELDRLHNEFSRVMVAAEPLEAELASMRQPYAEGRCLEPDLSTRRDEVRRAIVLSVEQAERVKAGYRRMQDSVHYRLVTRINGKALREARGKGNQARVASAVFQTFEYDQRMGGMMRVVGEVNKALMDDASAYEECAAAAQARKNRLLWGAAGLCLLLALAAAAWAWKSQPG